jgi:hypothetical protein
LRILQAAKFQILDLVASLLTAAAAAATALDFIVRALLAGAVFVIMWVLPLIPRVSMCVCSYVVRWKPSVHVRKRFTWWR